MPFASPAPVPAVIGPGYYHPRWAWAWRGLSMAMIPDITRGLYTDQSRSRSPALAGGSAPYRRTSAGLGFDFTGSTTGGYTSFGGGAVMQCPGSFTVAAVCYSDGEAASQALIAKGNNSESAGQNHNYWLSYDQGTFTDDQAGNGWLVGFERADSAGANVTAKYVTTNDAGPHVVMGVLDVPAQQLRVYVDGMLRRTRSSVTTVPETNDVDVLIGRFQTDGDSINRWNGTITGAFVWKDRAFTDAEALLWSGNPFDMVRRPMPALTLVTPPPAIGRSFCAGMIG